MNGIILATLLSQLQPAFPNVDGFGNIINQNSLEYILKSKNELHHEFPYKENSTYTVAHELISYEMRKINLLENTLKSMDDILEDSIEKLNDKKWYKKLVNDNIPQNKSAGKIINFFFSYLKKNYSIDEHELYLNNIFIKGKNGKKSIGYRTGPFFLYSFVENLNSRLSDESKIDFSAQLDPNANLLLKFNNGEFDSYYWINEKSKKMELVYIDNFENDRKKYSEAIENKVFFNDLTRDEIVGVGLGSILAWISPSDVAIQYSKDALKKLKKQPFAEVIWGIELQKDQKYEESISHFDKALEFNPKDSKALTYRGLSYHEIGKLDQSINDLEEAIEYDPNDSLPHFYIGGILIKIYEKKHKINNFTEDSKESIGSINFGINHLISSYELGEESFLVPYFIGTGYHLLSKIEKDKNKGHLKLAKKYIEKTLGYNSNPEYTNIFNNMLMIINTKISKL